MAYTTNELISSAYYVTNIVSRGFETPSGEEISDGLRMLNETLADKVVDEGMIPYEGEASINCVAGQEKYTIPNLIQIDTITFFKQNVRYSLRYQKRNQYFGSPRVESVTSLPFSWYFERQFGGGDLYLHFSPDQAYPLEIRGAFRLDSVALAQDLTLTLDQFYIGYLRYALAEKLCAEYAITMPLFAQKQLAKYESFINNKSRRIDLRMQKSSSLSKRAYINWGIVNINNGYLPIDY